jgi:hypothetical protein
MLIASGPQHYSTTPFCKPHKPQQLQRELILERTVLKRSSRADCSETSSWVYWEAEVIEYGVPCLP